MIYDAIIIGGGPAGMTAGIYLVRAGLKVLILEKETIGGQIATTPFLENYPGLANISGAELADNMYEQVTNLGAEFEIEEVREIIDGKIKKIITEDGEYETKSIIIATGSKYRSLGIETEEKFMGEAIHFCVACDGAFYKDKIVAVIGGGNSAVTNAIELAKTSSKVYLIQDLAELTCEETLINKVNSLSNVEIILNSSIESFNGDESLESITVNSDGKTQDIKVDGVFESVGMDAQTELVKDLVELNSHNYIIGSKGITNKSGIFVAGDCRDKEIRQLTTAVADGTTAALATINFLKN